MAKLSLVPPKQNIEMYSGDTTNIMIYIPADLSTATVSMSVKQEDGTALFTLAEGSGITVTANDLPPNGLGTYSSVRIAPSSNQTSLLEGVSAVYDIQAVTGAEVRTWLRGSITAIADTTG